MDLDQLANLGEFVGGIAVLVTLVYLAVQVRSSAQEQRVSSMREATREMGSFVQTVVETPERAAIFLQGLSDFDSLEPTARLRFSAIMGHLFRLFEQIYYQSREGRFDPEVWRGFESQLHDIAAYPGFEAWWPTRNHWYGERFRAFVASHVGEHNEPQMYGEKPAE